MKPEHPSWWDPHSDQPFKLDRSQKPRMKADNLNEYLRTALTAIGSIPAVAWHYACSQKHSPPPPTDFIGLGISPDHGDHNEVADLTEELGVQKLLLRVPSWHVSELDYYLDFAARFKGRDLLINILQSRQSVLDPSQWLDTIDQIITAFYPLTKTFQIGNAVNRSKWGCRHTGEYLELLKRVKRSSEESTWPCSRGIVCY